jgi:chromosomal replication initiator protein
MSTTWKKCLETLKDTVPVGQFSVWIKPLKAQEKNGTLTILAPNDSAGLQQCFLPYCCH